MNQSKAAVFAAALAVLSCSSALGFSKARSQPQASTPARKIVRLLPIQNVAIALPQAVDPLSGATNAPFYDFGPNLGAALAEKMQSGSYILDEPKAELKVQASSQALFSVRGDTWDGSSVVPAATFKFTIDALTFRTGKNGDTMFYGFDERFRTPFNDGTLDHPNEFPLSVVQFQHWFDRTFQDRGTAPFDTYSGLDLGEGFTLNALVAWVEIKYAAYLSGIRMRVEMDAPLAGRHEMKTVSVNGRGFYFDIVGGYELWAGGIGLARSDAMTAAFKNAMGGAYSAIDTWAKGLPLTAKLFGYASADKIYLNTGINSEIPVGTRYVAVSKPDVVCEVVENVPSSGSIAKLVSGKVEDLQLGMILIEQKAVPKALAVRSMSQALVSSSKDPTPAGNETVSLPDQNLPRSDFASHGWNPNEDYWQAFFTSLIELPLLPYRIWRYYQHDQDFDKNEVVGSVPDNGSGDPASSDAPSSDGPADTAEWVQKFKTDPVAKQIGLDVAPDMTVDGPVVAVIDSGVDYNHPVLHERIWKNPAPFKDPTGAEDTYGWDFISGDARPYDDNYHGTEVASVVLAVAPRATIMPLKVFNAYGITSSAAMFGAFQYAVDHGAKIIVAAWATQKATEAVATAIRYAHDHGALVVVSAGDRGDDLAQAPSYPVSLAKKYDNVLAVTGVDSDDQLVKQQSFFANFDNGTIALAAPGKDVLVAQPRNHISRDTTTSMAAALVAGAVARNWAAEPSANYAKMIQSVREQSQYVPGLASSVAAALRLRVK